MCAVESKKPGKFAVLNRQLMVCAAFGVLLAIIVASLYWQDRRREWALRREQANHRLDLAFKLISHEIDRVRADALFLADQQAVRQFASGDDSRFDELRAEYSNFVDRKETYDQIRLLDLNGRELIRVNYVLEKPTSVLKSELQDKSDRYYFHEALLLNKGDVFISEFDLNVEHGQIEMPLNPVIRFATPVVDDAGNVAVFLVLNYRGARLLDELDSSSLPGFTMLLRADGNYLRSPNKDDAWGWLLGHDRTFASQFPSEWARIHELQDCKLTGNGAFAAKRIPLGRTMPASAVAGNPANKDSIIVVSYLDRRHVFTASNELLKRLLLLAGCVFVPLAVFARYWAQATLSRQMQARQIAISEEQLRELSSRLLRIQEDERRAISREIHDELGQQVTAINLDLKLAGRSLDSGAAASHLQRAIRENEGLLNSLHAFATRVRPAVLDDLGLRDAVESHLWEFQQRTGIKVDTSLGFNSADIPDEIADNAFRLLQESLNNVVKHAEASSVRVTMSVKTNAAPKQFCMVIRDDGCGYREAEKGSQRLGLVGMQERVDLLAGVLRVESGIDQGTQIEIRLPLPRVAEPVENSA